MMNKLSIVIPVYNEEEGIIEAIHRITETMINSGIIYEIIVVDDGSKDKTADLLKGKDNFTVIRHSVNKGYGASLLDGIRKSKYEYVAIIDADGTYPYEDIPKLCLQLKDEDYDMIVGVRTGKHALGSYPRRIAKWFITNLANYLVGERILDINSGMRIIKKDMVLKFSNILPQNFSFTTTITLAMLSNNYNVKYVPIAYNKRKGGKSKIKPLQETFNFIQLIIRTTMYFNPLKIFLPIGVILFIAMVISIIFDIYHNNLTDKTAILVTLFFIVSTVGALADLIDKRLAK